MAKPPNRYVSDDGKKVWEQLERINRFGYGYATIFSDWLDLMLNSLLSLTANVHRPDIVELVWTNALDDEYNTRYMAIRLAALIDIWGTLPDLPSTGEPFTAGDMTMIELQDECNALEAKLRAARVADAEANKDLKRFNEKNEEWDRFVTAALAQGRVLYGADTPERAALDTIPTAPSTQPPDQAEIDLAESPDDAAVRLEFSAEHATSFKVFHKGPGDAVFTEVADVLLPGEYSAVGLTAGTHDYKIVGVNSRGEGPASEIASIDVVVAAAA